MESAASEPRTLTPVKIVVAGGLLEFEEVIVIDVCDLRNQQERRTPTCGIDVVVFDDLVVLVRGSDPPLHGDLQFRRFNNLPAA